MFRVTDIATMVGRSSIEELEDLAGYLEYRLPRDSSRNYIARLAPSLISRSEGLLFNLDIPRFSIRLYLDQKQTAFVNLRRMTEAADRIVDYRWLEHRGPITLPIAGETTRKEAFEPLSNDLMPVSTFVQQTKISAIADCILKVSPRMAAEYDLVTAEVGWVYGEQTSIEGVPYVRPVAKMGGAACAQACAFMLSTCLMGRRDDRSRSKTESAGAHGLVEITAITTQDKQPFLKLAGLRGKSLLDYFSKIGKNPFFHNFRGNSNRECAHALFRLTSVYIRSGFSCILPCKGNSGESRDNVWNHAVVVVGAHSRRNTKWRAAFVVNDPQGDPLDIWYTPTIETLAVRDLNGKPFSAMMCVLPSEVKTPLTKSYTCDAGSDDYVVWGIVELAAYLERANKLSTGDVTPTHIDQFYLHRIELEKTDEGDRVAFPDIIRSLAEDDTFDPAWRNSSRVKRLSGQWCWLQVRADANGQIRSVVIWDAQLDPQRFGLAKELADKDTVLTAASTYFIAEFVRNADRTWTLRTFDQVFAHRPWPRNRAWYRQVDGRETLTPIENLEAQFEPSIRSAAPSSAPLEPALITSFSANTLSQSCAAWPQGIHAAELYTFMHRDDELMGPLRQYILPARNGRPTPPAVNVLAALQDPRIAPRDRINALKGLANGIHRRLTAKSIRMGAFATYIPQLYSHQPELRQDGAWAMLTLIELTQLLRKKGHDVRTIQIVAGSTIEGLIPVKAPGNSSEVFLCAKRRIGTAVRSFVLEQLHDLCSTALEMFPGCFDKMSLSLDLDPGPLFSLNSPTSLGQFAAHITNDAILSKVVGFNIDISHFTLAGIHPKAIFDSKLAAHRITHFHISDQGTGHFGDAPIGDCGLGKYAPFPEDRIDIFEEWINYAWDFAEAYKREKRRWRAPARPVFSGLISVLSEAAQSESAVQRSCTVLQELLSRAAQRRRERAR